MPTNNTLNTVSSNRGRQSLRCQIAKAQAPAVSATNSTAHQGHPMSGVIPANSNMPVSARIIAPLATTPLTIGRVACTCASTTFARSASVSARNERRVKKLPIEIGASGKAPPCTTGRGWGGETLRAVAIRQKR